MIGFSTTANSTWCNSLWGLKEFLFRRTGDFYGAARSVGQSYVIADDGTFAVAVGDIAY